MAEQSKTNNANSLTGFDKPLFHDFLGPKTVNSTLVLPSKPIFLDARAQPETPSHSVSASGGSRGPISSTSDLGSGIPYYGPRSDISNSMTDVSNRLVGSKRSNSDSVFTGHESPESLHLMKILRGGGSRRSIDDDALYTTKNLRPSSVSHMLHPLPGKRIHQNISKWDRGIPVNVSGHQVPHPRSHFASFMHQVSSSNKFKDTTIGTGGGPSSGVVSHLAADEGSRTGIKGQPGILNTISASNNGGANEKNSPWMLPRPKSGTQVSEPESSSLSLRQELAFSNRQMTVFYGGQAHVFDDVHPNKADVILSLAGSNGGSWSTTYLPKSVAKPANEGFVSAGDFHGRLSTQGSGYTERNAGQQGRGIIVKETRNAVEATEANCTEDRREVQI